MKKLALLFWLALGLGAPAYAANVNIDGLTAASSVATGDLFECEQSAVNHKCTSDQIKTFANTSAVDARTTTTEAINTGDQNKIVTFCNASATAASIAQATAGTFFNGWATSLKNNCAGTVTLTATTSLIFDNNPSGSATLTLLTGQGVDLYSDGTNYSTQPGKGGGGAPTGSAGGDLAGTYPNPTLSFASASAAAAAADADTFPTNQGAGTLKQTLAAIKTWIKAWITKTDVGLSNVPNTDATNATNITTGSLPVAQIGGSAASHAVPVDVAGTSTYKVVPNCTDTVGNHLNYTQSTDAFSCGTSSSGGGVPAGHGSYATGVFYQTYDGSVAVGGTATGNTLYFYPFYVSATISPATFNIWVTTGVAASTYMAGVYTDSGGLPSNSAPSCVAASSAATATNAAVSTLTLSGCSLTAGWYWMGVNISGAITTMSVGSSAGTAGDHGSYLNPATTASQSFGAGSAGATVHALSVANTVVSGSMPTLSSPTFTRITTLLAPAVVFGN